MGVQSVLAWIGYPLVFLAAVHAVLGSILMRRPLRGHPILGAAAAISWASATACLSLGMAYVDAAYGLNPDLPYRVSWISWLPAAGGIQLVLAIRDPSGRMARLAGWIAYPLAAAIVVLALATDWVQAGSPQFMPFRDAPGPLSGPIDITGAFVGVTFLVLALTTLRWPPKAMDPRAPRLILGLVAAGTVAIGVQIAGWVLGSFDSSLAVIGSVFWAVGIVAALGPRGLLDLDIAAVHLGLVLLWGMVLAFIQFGLWMLLSPPVPGGIALGITAVLVVLGAYLLLPLSQRTLDRIDSALLSGRKHKPVLQQCMRAAATYLDLEQLLDYLSRTLVREVGISNVSFLLEDDQGALRTEHARNAPRDRELPPGSALPGWLMLERRALRAVDVERMPEGSERDALRSEIAALEADVVLPLSCRGRLLGLMALGPMGSAAPYEHDDVEMLAALADHAAIAVENARLFRSATTDGLTGLLQRAYFLTRLKEEMDRGKRYGRAASLLMLDIDHFKRVNDGFGHAEGDIVLKEVASLLRRGLRSSDVACRYGGEEFVVMLPETSADLAMRVAERLREAIAATPIGQAGTVTVSIGVAEMRAEQAAETLIQQADVAMYQAKRSGRNRVVQWKSRSRDAAAEADSDPAAPIVEPA